VSVLNVLEPYAAFNAKYNSRERQDQQASICMPGTRTRVIDQIMEWATNENDRTNPICWLYGPAGTGKSSVAHTIAESLTEKGWLVLTFFFSRSGRDRTSLTKVFTTLAYQLAASKALLPSAQQLIGEAIQDRSVFSANFGIQFHRLVADPIMFHESVPQIIIIIDGLDECDSPAYQTLLVKLLVEMPSMLASRARFLVTSRPEEQIVNEFGIPAARNVTQHLPLYDFDAREDIMQVCRDGFAKIARSIQWKGIIPTSWPSETEMGEVIWKSEGIFIYISTLLRFVGEGDGLPQDKLHYALKAHIGLDGIYHQVLGFSGKENHQVVIMAISNLRGSFTIMELGKFLDLTPAQIKSALQGMRSILNIPDDNNDAILPYHASLGDFVQDSTRSKGHFGTLSVQHGTMMKQCIRLAITMIDPGSAKIVSKPALYACRNWCFHLAAMLASPDGLANNRSQIQPLKNFLLNLKQTEWLRCWLYALHDGAHGGCNYVISNNEKLEEAEEQLQVQTSLQHCNHCFKF
jgi:AAA ATPase domain